MTFKKTFKITNLYGEFQLCIIISIQSIHGVKILTKEKLLELRMSIPKGFTGPVYIYITKAEPYLVVEQFTDEKQAFIYTGSKLMEKYHSFVNGKIVARFWFDEYVFIYPHFSDSLYGYGFYEKLFEYYRAGGKFYENKGNKLLLNSLQLEDWEIEKYLIKNEDNYRDGYGWFIKNLEIFDEPMELKDFYKRGVLSKNSIPFKNKSGSEIYLQPITKAPQSWQYIWVKSNA